MSFHNNVEYSERHGTFTDDRHFSISPSSTYTSSPLPSPNFEKTKSLNLPPWFLFKTSPSSLHPYHYISQKSVLTESTSSPCAHSLSHSTLTPVPTPPLTLPSPRHQRLSSLISGLTLLILCCNRHLPSFRNISFLASQSGLSPTSLTAPLRFLP